MAQPFLHIRSQLFPVLPGESDEIVNPDTWGRALSDFISKGLTALGYKCDFGVEDWGWSVVVSRDGCLNEVGIYSDKSQESQQTDYVVTLMREGRRRFSLKRLKHIDDTAWCDTLNADLQKILVVEGVEVVSVTDDMPF